MTYAKLKRYVATRSIETKAKVVCWTLIILFAGYMVASRSKNHYPILTPKDQVAEDQQRNADHERDSVQREQDITKLSMIRYMRGEGFTAEDSERAVKAAQRADPDLGTPGQILARMAWSAKVGLMNQEFVNSIGTTKQAIQKVSGQDWNGWQYYPVKLRLSILCLAMEQEEK
jgi:hypothetical protein